jgi:CheY-like chemotaxis protein
MVELGDMSFFREVKSIMMPVYSLPIANTLNNVSEEDIKELNRRSSCTALGAKILIVDDISSNLRVAKELMAPYKAEVHTCLSGAEAVELVQKNRYDMVFMDHMMPGMDGLEATAAIRILKSSDDYYRNLPIIALTANAVSGQQELFLQRGLNDFIAKPIEVKRLNAVLERWTPESKKIVTVPEDPAESGETIGPIPGIDLAAGLRNAGEAEQKITGLLEDITALTNAICGALAARQTEMESRNGTDVYVPHLELLKKAIGALDIDSVNKILLEYLSVPMNGDAKTKVSAIEQHILMFEYDQAVERIDQMLKS